MPRLEDDLHLEMHREFQRAQGLVPRLRRWLNGALRARREPQRIYGLEWGDPENCPPLTYVRDRYLRPYVGPSTTVLEIGPGGGRWTRYMLDAQELIVVDFHRELLDELARTFRGPNIRPVQNTGTDFPGVADASVDFLFSFGVFVHLDLDLIGAYLGNMRRILKPTANVVLQYADKTKILARENPGFSDNTPDRMRELVRSTGYRIVEEDLTTLWHSAVIRFTPQADVRSVAPASAH